MLATSCPVAMNKAASALAAVRSVVRRAGQKCARHLDIASAVQIRGRDVHELLQNIAAQNCFGDHSFAAPQQHVHLRMFFVRIDVSGKEIFGMKRMIVLDPFACRIRRLARHILSRRHRRCV